MAFSSVDCYHLGAIVSKIALKSLLALPDAISTCSGDSKILSQSRASYY